LFFRRSKERKQGREEEEEEEDGRAGGGRGNQKKKVKKSVNIRHGEIAEPLDRERRGGWDRNYKVDPLPLAGMRMQRGRKMVLGRECGGDVGGREEEKEVEVEVVEEKADDCPGGDGLLRWWGRLVGHFLFLFFFRQSVS
jgi:hypothetical protein